MNECTKKKLAEKLFTVQVSKMKVGNGEIDLLTYSKNMNIHQIISTVEREQNLVLIINFGRTKIISFRIITSASSINISLQLVKEM